MVEINYVEEDFQSELPAVELKAAEEATYAFLMAVKNYGLLPPEHASTQNMLNGLTNTINLFTKEYGELRLEIEKNRILYSDETVYEEANHDENQQGPARIGSDLGQHFFNFLPQKGLVKMGDILEGIPQKNQRKDLKLLSHRPGKATG